MSIHVRGRRRGKRRRLSDFLQPHLFDQLAEMRRGFGGGIFQRLPQTITNLFADRVAVDAVDVNLRGVGLLRHLLLRPAIPSSLAPETMRERRIGFAWQARRSRSTTISARNDGTIASRAGGSDLQRAEKHCCCNSLEKIGENLPTEG